jgi:PadR family transcriptional regulator AphA
VIKLTPTSYIVLGFLELAPGSTPYELKQAVGVSVGNFWSLQHAQLYTEPERLTKAGYLTEKREKGGRRRKRYTLTARGRKALDDWRREATDELSELRDPGLLKLFFGADQAELAAVQLEAHKRQLREYEELRAADTGDGPRGPWQTLDAGIAHERVWIRFWSALSADGS